MAYILTHLLNLFGKEGVGSAGIKVGLAEAANIFVNMGLVRTVFFKREGHDEGEVAALIEVGIFEAASVSRAFEGDGMAFL